MAMSTNSYDHRGLYHPMILLIITLIVMQMLTATDIQFFISYMSCFDLCSRLLLKVYRFKFFESNVLRWFD